MIRKKNQWLFALPLALLLLTGLAVLAFFYLLPRHLKQNELPEWLERNQRHFRIGGIASGSYNAVRIRLFSIGDPDAPLLIAPEAELFFDYPAERSFQKPRFKELRLREVPLKVDLVQNQLRINGHPAADFITGLTELPAGPDGGFIQLTLESLLLLPGRQTPAPCLIRVEREAQSGCFTFQGEWQSDGRQGTWHARLNRAKGEITFRVAGALTVDFLQEFLLRAKLPRGLATFIRGGDLQGQGSFSADFPALQLKLLRFNGTLRGGALNWYGSTFEPVRPLTFAFAGTPEALELSWNDLAVAAPAPVSIQNFQLQYHARRSHSTFTARADVGSALLRSIDRRFGASWQSLRPMTARLSGRVNWHTGDWQCANQDEALPSRDWLMKGAGEEQLALTANQFTFSGKGTGCRGRYSAALSFQDMEFQYGHGSWRSPKGELRGNWRFTGRAGQPGIVFEFNLDKLSADTPHGQLELGSPAGELDFRPAPGGQNEFYLIARAESYNLLHSLLQLNGGRIQTEISALRNDADGRFARKFVFCKVC